MNKAYYSDYYHYERSHWWFRVRSAIIERNVKAYIADGRCLRILNVGVATGATTQMLEKYGEVVSVEYDKDCYDFVKGVLSGEVINASITELPFAQASFDLVCAFDVIEHVPEHDLAVREMDRVTKPGGFVYVTVPAFMSLWSKHDIINQHVRRYKRRDLRALFASLNGKEIYSTYFNSFLFLPIFLFRYTVSKFRNPEKDLNVTSDFEVIKTKSLAGKFINSILGGIFSLEKFFLRFMRFPVGVSILLLHKKSDE